MCLSFKKQQLWQLICIRKTVVSNIFSTYCGKIWKLEYLMQTLHPETGMIILKCTFHLITVTDGFSPRMKTNLFRGLQYLISIYLYHMPQFLPHAIPMCFLCHSQIFDITYFREGSLKSRRF